MSKLIQIGVNNGTGPEYFYAIGVCGEPLTPYTGNPTTETSIIVDLVDYGWSEGQQYCYEVADLGSGCSCSESGPPPTQTPTLTVTQTQTPSNTQTQTLTQSVTNTPSDDGLIFTLTACTISDGEQSTAGSPSYFCEGYGETGATLTIPTLVNEPCDLAAYADNSNNVSDDYILCLYQYYFSTGDTSNLQLLDINDDGQLSTADLLSFLAQFGEAPLSTYGCTFYSTETQCTQNGLVIGQIYYNETENACYEVVSSEASGGTVLDCGTIDINNDYESCTTCQQDNVYFWQLTYVPWDYSYSPNLGSGEFNMLFLTNDGKLTGVQENLNTATHVLISKGSNNGNPTPTLTSLSSGTLLVQNSINTSEYFEVDVTLVTDGTEPPGFVSFVIDSIVSQSAEPPLPINGTKLDITMFE